MAGSGRDRYILKQSNIYAGGLAGCIYASYTNIHNCYVEAEGNGTIRGEGDFAFIGGIAGKANVEITHCYATVNVEVTNNRAARIGGIVDAFAIEEL